MNRNIRFHIIFLFIFFQLFPAFYSNVSALGNKRKMANFEIYCSKKTVRPGEIADFDIVVIRRNGRSYNALYKDYTSKNLKAKQHWADFDIQIKGGSVAEGKIYINKDLRTYTKDFKVEITITHKELKHLKKTLLLRVDPNGETFFSFGGNDGFDGSKGDRGHRWFARQGVSGDTGGAGEDGANGDDIVVYIKPDFIPESKDTFLRVLVKCLAKDTSIVFLHNIKNFPLSLSTSGGDGGDGAKGGRGSNGKDARDETEKKSGRPAGDGGDGGNGGNGGRGGNAGAIIVFFEKGAANFIGKITFYNSNGRGGKGGPGGRGGIGGSGTSVYPSGKNGNDGLTGQDGQNGALAPSPSLLMVEKIPVNF